MTEHVDIDHLEKRITVAIAADDQSISMSPDVVMRLIFELRERRGILADGPRLELIAMHLYEYDRGDKDWPSWGAIGMLRQAQFVGAVKVVLGVLGKSP
jgi:hypothetical protein